MAEGAGLPYVGSLMSLVTHGGARYEGILASIDMPNSSISLSNGTSFTTHQSAFISRIISFTLQASHIEQWLSR